VLTTLISFRKNASEAHERNSNKNKTAKQQNMTGQVLEMNTNQPIAGATVKVKNKDIVEQTNEDGEFSIEGIIGDVLVVTSVGYQSEEHKVEFAFGNIIYSTNIKEALDEVVVVRYDKMRK